jgi:hypothetical protein
VTRAKQFPGESGVRRLPAGTIQLVERRANGAATEYEIAVSSEQPVERGFYGLRWREVLGHGSDEVDLTRFKSGRAALLEEHEGPPVGVIERARVDSDRVLRAIVRFSNSERGQEVERDVVEGIRSNASVGYVPKKARLVEEDAENGDLWRVTEWEPVELSIVGVPADASVGVGRYLSGGFYPPVEIQGGVTVGNNGNAATVRDREAEVLEISQMAREYGVELGPSWLERKLSPDQVGREILKGQVTRDAAQPAAESFMDGLSARDQRDVATRLQLCVRDPHRCGRQAWRHRGRGGT